MAPATLSPRRSPTTPSRNAEIYVGEVRLVAAHSWDITGAMAGGCQAAFVARPGTVLSPLGDPPGITGADLAAVAEQIITIDG